jgi:hypothetical protein
LLIGKDRTWIIVLFLLLILLFFFKIDEMELQKFFLKLKNDDLGFDNFNFGEFNFNLKKNKNDENNKIDETEELKFLFVKHLLIDEFLISDGVDNFEIGVNDGLDEIFFKGGFKKYFKKINLDKILNLFKNFDD